MDSLSEEEKKAIEEAKKQIEEVHNLNDILIFMTDSRTLKILLNLIDRLQKEKEEYRELLLNVVERENKKVNKYWLDKIRKVLEEIKKQDKRYRFVGNEARNGAYDICIKKIEDLLKE